MSMSNAIHYKLYAHGEHNPWKQIADTPSMWLEHSDNENKETSHGNGVKALNQRI